MSRERRKIPKPTEGELAILRVLWEHGPATVRQVQDALEQERGTGYTTSLKLMQIMLEKGLLKRDDSAHAHVYQAAVSRESTQKRLVSDLLDQVFEGSAQQLVMQALSAKKSSPDDLAAIRQLLDEMERSRP
jgi:BlaI family transcriptional regulator, penicillinase repressor